MFTDEHRHWHWGNTNTSWFLPSEASSSSRHPPNFEQLIPPLSVCYLHPTLFICLVHTNVLLTCWGNTNSHSTCNNNNLSRRNLNIDPAKFCNYLPLATFCWNGKRWSQCHNFVLTPGINWQHRRVSGPVQLVFTLTDDFLPLSHSRRYAYHIVNCNWLLPTLGGILRPDDC